MPGPYAHLWLADRAFDTLNELQAAYRNAFYLGTLSPDVGYWPGGTHTWSDLSHYIGAITLSKRLLEVSRTPEWTAFAQGWKNAPDLG